MENNIKIASDSLSDAMTVLQLLEVNVEQDEYNPYILRSLRIIDNLLHTAKTALPQRAVQLLRKHSIVSFKACT